MAAFSQITLEWIISRSKNRNSTVTLKSLQQQNLVWVDSKRREAFPWNIKWWMTTTSNSRQNDSGFCNGRYNKAFYLIRAPDWWGAAINLAITARIVFGFRERIKLLSELWEFKSKTLSILKDQRILVSKTIQKCFHPKNLKQLASFAFRRNN